MRITPREYGQLLAEVRAGGLPLRIAGVSGLVRELMREALAAR